MGNKEEKKPMPKWLIYTLFIGKFGLSLALIWWTVYMTLQSDVGKDDDNAFLSSYHDIDDNYNKLIENNNKFNVKYNTNRYTIMIKAYKLAYIIILVYLMFI